MNKKALGDISTIFNGKTPAKTEQRKSGFPVLKIRDVTEHGQFVGRFQSFVDTVFFKQHQSKQLQCGDILILNAAHNSAYVGSKLYLVDGSVQGAIATGEWLVVRPNTTVLDSNYANHWLRSPLVKQALRDLVKGIHLYPTDVERLRIHLPTIADQRRIAATLTTADAVLQKRRESLQIADELLRSIFIHSVGPQAPDYTKWQEYCIEELLEQTPGSIRSGPFGSQLLHSEFVETGIAVLGIDNAVNNRFQWAERRFITAEKFKMLQRFQVFPNDVIITIMGTTGRSAVVPEGIPTAITTKHLACLTLDKRRCFPAFLSFSLHSHPEIIRQIRAAQRGAIMDGLNLGIIKGLRLRLPPIDKQEYFTQKQIEVDHLREKQCQYYDAAVALFQAIQQRSFQGNL